MKVKPRTFDDYPSKFKVNDYITLVLHQGKTNILVKERLFRQCKYILLTISVDEGSSLDEVRSVDEAADLLNHSEEPVFENMTRQIDPETEFWAHSSNLQAWAENDYDTRLIHRNLAFPLLRELVEAGDPKAIRAFKEEIIKRFESNHPAVVSYLKEEGYLDYLSHESQLLALLEPEEAEALLNIELKYGVEFELVEQKALEYSYSPKSRWYAGISNKNLITLELDGVNINSIIDDVLKFSNLQSIGFKDENMVKLPDEMRNLDSLAEIGVYAPKVKQIQDWLLDFKDLRLFSINGDSLERKSLKTVKKMREKGVDVDLS